MAQIKYVNRDPDYRDLDLDFFANPSTGDVFKKEGEEAIKRSVRNILFTNFYERLFQPSIGSNVRKLLFEPVNPFTITLLQNAIKETINNFEPRVTMVDVTVSSDIDNNGFNVRLQYVIKNRNMPIDTTLFLERIR